MPVGFKMVLMKTRRRCKKTADWWDFPQKYKPSSQAARRPFPMQISCKLLMFLRQKTSVIHLPLFDVFKFVTQIYFFISLLKILQRLLLLMNLEDFFKIIFKIPFLQTKFFS